MPSKPAQSSSAPQPLRPSAPLSASPSASRSASRSAASARLAPMDAREARRLKLLANSEARLARLSGAGKATAAFTSSDGDAGESNSATNLMPAEATQHDSVRSGRKTETWTRTRTWRNAHWVGGGARVGFAFSRKPCLRRRACST